MDPQYIALSIGPLVRWNLWTFSKTFKKGFVIANLLGCHNLRKQYFFMKVALPLWRRPLLQSKSSTLNSILRSKVFFCVWEIFRPLQRSPQKFSPIRHKMVKKKPNLTRHSKLHFGDHGGPNKNIKSYLAHDKNLLFMTCKWKVIIYITMHLPRH